MIVSKKNLLKFCCYGLNILITLIVCISLSSCGSGDLPPLDPSVLFSDAGQAYASGELEESRELLMQVIMLDPENPNAWRNLGTVNLDLGFYEEAVSSYERVIQLDSARVDVLTDLTAALLGSGRIQEALHTGELSIQLTPDDGLAFNNYGMALLEAGMFGEAAGCFNTALRREPDNPSVLYNCGRITQMAGESEEALLFFESSCAADPGYLPSRLELARTLGILERHPEAEEQVLAFLAVSPSHPEGMNILALAYSGQGKQLEAIEILSSLLEQNPEDLHSMLGIADCYFLSGDIASALENYRLFMTAVGDTTGTSGIRLRIQELEALLD